MKGHPDDFRLLCYQAGELGEKESRAIAVHVARCPRCRAALEGIERLGSELRGLAGAGLLERDLAPSRFGLTDPFRRRPAPVARRAGRVGLEGIQASDAGVALSGRLLDAIAGARQPYSVLRGRRWAEPEQRFAVYHGLQESARRITENPGQARKFAEAVLRLRKPADRSGAGKSAEAMLPWLTVQAQAHLLAGQADLWFKEFKAARAHLIAAYRSFARGGDETSLAIVELTESQRRSFLGEGKQALSLARRARSTFEERGLEAFGARAAVAEGLALVAEGQFEGALAAYREALPVFERLEIWSNYVGAVNSLATALYKLGRLDEAKGEFARVLRRLSHEQHRAVLGYLRHGLADILFSAGRFREAAISFARASQLFEESGLRANALLTRLTEAESWARHGSPGRARERLDMVTNLIRNDRSLDRDVRRRIAQAVAGAVANSDEIADLRIRAQGLLDRPQ